MQQKPVVGVRPYVPPKKVEVINISGKWQSEENETWIMKQSGSEVDIAFYNKKNENIGEVTGNIIGKEFTFTLKKRGRDKKGSFTISDDGNTLRGTLSKTFGHNSITVKRIE